jgi:ketosteroid isomerase-like protein
VNERVQRHTERFNAAQRSGDWAPFVATFAPDAVMRFAGVPAGPFVGREAIRAAYEAQPPTDTMSVTSVDTDGDTDVVRFAWDAGGVGTLTVRWRGEDVVELTVAFD